MSFMKNRIIYERGRTKVYINQCHNPGRKTKLFAVRRDDKRGLGEFLGDIRFCGAWRQYVFHPEPLTKWSAGCMDGISDFCEEQTKRLRTKWKERRGKTLTMSMLKKAMRTVKKYGN